MEAGLQQLSLLLVTCLCCADAQGTTDFMSGIPSTTDPNTDITLPKTTDGPTTPAAKEIPYACPSRRNTWHTCFFGCLEPPWKQFYCHCDDLCLTYDDCCPDYEEYCGVGTFGVDEMTTVGVGVIDGDRRSGIENTAEYMRCIQTDEFDPEGSRPRSGFWLVAVCPQDWTGAAAVTELCEETIGIDGLAAVPVEGFDRRHYRNVYCAMCHGLPHTDVTFWTICYKDNSGETARPIPNSLFLQIARGQVPSDGYQKFFNPPNVDDAEYLAPSMLRTCSILDAISCPISDPRALELCQRHYAPITWNGTTYRNFACVRCDDTPIPPSDILSTWCTFSRSGEKGGSMATLLVFSDHTDIGGSLTQAESVGSNTACTHRQIYDPFSSSCLDLSCPEGFALRDGGVGCARIRETENESTGLKSNVEVALTVTVSLDMDTEAQHTNGLSEIWEEVAHQAAKDYQSTTSLCEFDEEMTENNQVDRDDEICDDFSVQWSCTMDVAILDSTPACLSGSVFKCSINVSFDSLSPSVDHFIAQSDELSSKCFVSRVWNHTIRPDYLAVSTPCDNLSNDTGEDSNFNIVFTSKVAYVRDKDSGHFVVSQNDSCMELFVDCPLLTFSKEDYVITGALNDSIRLTAHDRVFRSGEFEIKSDGDVEVCNFLPPSADPPYMTFGPAQDILTATGSSLSLIGLVVTIATYVAFPSLRRNAAGRALMSLVAALFIAQLTMLIGLDRTDVPTLCVTFAISSHYFWLAAFFWMNILAVDIYRTFGIGTSLSDPNERSFLRYALYGWGAPTLIVATVAILSFCDCVDADVSYGTARACWVGNGTANLLSFGLPIVLILCSNAVLFSLTVAGVRRTRMTSKRMNICQGQSGLAAERSNNDLLLYLKLTAIMGFTWVFGFVASFSGVEFFWYLYIVLNSTQGALVCLAFVCNRRVLAMWRAWLDSRRGRSDASASGRGQRSFKSAVTEQRQAESAIKDTYI
ncbi:uncharacterized protein LOC119725175 [Patiria miniata]|uniref:G-protein coupled receptors family 2 profile 2 domain-containing protein n=1 Tax=Patiria miniata TaxID=46514 RepID=A0A913ZM92_PATMI|nr:uncharacterized protein LOC119725175 [Patiria miniata]